MSAVEDRDVADQHVAAKFQADRFVGPAGFDRISWVGVTEGALRLAGPRFFQLIISFFGARLSAGADQALSPNHPWPKDRNIFQVFAPYQTVVPVTMAKV